MAGTDTGVGKTVFSLCLIRFLKQSGLSVAGLKPFCSGNREDAVRLWKEAACGLSLDQVNPFHFSAPLAPGSTEIRGRKPGLGTVLEHIEKIAGDYDVTVVEGIGGLCVPLSKGLLLADIIQNLEAEVILVARNALGTLNHTLLSVAELKRRGKRVKNIFLSENVPPDQSQLSNRPTLLQHVVNVRITMLPNLSEWPELRFPTTGRERIFQKTLATI